MNKHSKKIIAPVVISVLVILYYLVYYGIIIMTIKNVVLKVLFGFIPLILSAAMLYVCIQRIREIKTGEEEDLDQY